MTRHPGLWVTEFTNVGMVFGIMWNMTQKPGTLESVLAIAIGYAVGFALAHARDAQPCEGSAAGRGDRVGWTEPASSRPGVPRA